MVSVRGSAIALQENVIAVENDDAHAARQRLLHGTAGIVITRSPASPKRLGRFRRVGEVNQVSSGGPSGAAAPATATTAAAATAAAIHDRGVEIFGEREAFQRYVGFVDWFRSSIEGRFEPHDFFVDGFGRGVSRIAAGSGAATS